MKDSVLLLALSLLFVVGCEALRDVVENVVDEAIESIEQAVDDRETVENDDASEVDSVLRAACCFASDLEILAQIESLDAQKADGLSLLEALAKTKANCDDATDDDSFLELCCFACGAAVADHVYGVVP